MRNEFKENIRSVYTDPTDQKIIYRRDGNPKIDWRQYRKVSYCSKRLQGVTDLPLPHHVRL